MCYFHNKKKRWLEFSSHLFQTILEYKSYLKQYTLTYTNADGESYSRTHRNSSFGINRKMSSLRSLFSYLYKTDKISQNVTLKIDMNKLVQKIKKPQQTQCLLRDGALLRGTTHIRPFRAPFSRKTACSLTRKTAVLTVVQPCGSGTTFSGGFTGARTFRALSLHQPTDTPALHRHLDLL